ncbi:7317_t:CDS:2 [Diversispora eburnea]|uniref:7317_t:CDS:1 n=1 Tax=Diversispora eburnea TaxID=1213867 RepID=A0A9N9F792_9GLOM|nr:7317_t:CDS:2 [Diversispora eburnea]
MVRTCVICNKERAIIKRPKTRQQACRECFYYVFETEIHNTIIDSKLFNKGDKVAIAASGGKDSTVLAYVLKLLNERYQYEIELFLLSIDEGITGYRDDSLETVKRNQQQYDLPLKIVSYSELYGWNMDQIVKEVGLKNNCTFCGVFRRQALDRGAVMLEVDHIVTGHNADDIAETVLMNIMRGDIARLSRCTEIYLEGIRSIAIIGEAFELKKDVKLPIQGVCKRCGYMSSNEFCKACVLLEGLNRGLPKLGIGKTNKMLKKYGNMSEGMATIPKFMNKNSDSVGEQC